MRRARYKTAECRNVAIRHAIDAFSQFFDQIQDNRRIIRFIGAQVGNPRAPVPKRTVKSLREHDIVPREQDAK